MCWLYDGGGRARAAGQRVLVGQAELVQKQGTPRVACTWPQRG